MLKIGEKFQETENIFFGIFLENFLKKFVKKRIFFWRKNSNLAPFWDFCTLRHTNKPRPGFLAATQPERRFGSQIGQPSRHCSSFLWIYGNRIDREAFCQLFQQFSTQKTKFQQKNRFFFFF